MIYYQTLSAKLQQHILLSHNFSKNHYYLNLKNQNLSNYKQLAIQNSMMTHLPKY